MLTETVGSVMDVGLADLLLPKSARRGAAENLLPTLHIQSPSPVDSSCSELPPNSIDTVTALLSAPSPPPGLDHHLHTPQT